MSEIKQITEALETFILRAASESASTREVQALPATVAAWTSLKTLTTNWAPIKSPECVLDRIPICSIRSEKNQQVTTSQSEQYKAEKDPSSLIYWIAAIVSVMLSFLFSTVLTSDTA